MTSTRSPSTATATQLRWVLALTSTAYFMVILDTGALFAALSVAGPASRLDPLETNHVLIEQAVAAARAVSQRLAGQAPPQQAVRGE